MKTVSMRSVFIMGALGFVILGTSQEAHAGLFGCSRNDIPCLQRKEYKREMKENEKAFRRGQEEPFPNAQDPAENSQAPYAPQAPYAQQPSQAYPPAQQPQTYYPQPQPYYPQQPQYQPPQPSYDPGAVTYDNGQNGEVDKNGVPLFGANGQPLTATEKALWPFRHQTQVNMPVYVTKTEWSADDEDGFSQFVAQFGAGIKAHPMKLLNYYMHDPSINKFASTDPQGVYYYSDCADLPYVLRGYYAYKNGLPFSIATGAVMNMHPFASASSPGYDTWSMNNSDRTDVSPYGNSLEKRGATNVPSAPGREKNMIPQYWGNLMDAGSTRTFMVSPFTPNYSSLSDVYPVKMNRTGIRPGTLVHSDGHVLLVSNVTATGDVELIDAHPDNSLQFKTLDPSKLERDRPDRAYGFFRFRPMRLKDARAYNSPVGPAYFGGRIEMDSDQELFPALWSVEQWMGPGSNMAPGQTPDPMAWKRAFEDIPEFFFFIRGSLASQSQTSDQAAYALMTSLCTDVQQRVSDVSAASQYTSQAHPDSLPQNIYSAEPTWEKYATPSRDARVRQAILNLPDLLARYFRYGSRNKYALSYSGSAQSYQQRVGQLWQQLDSSCRVTYRNSAGQPVSLNFSQIVSRAPRMSFDYSDCTEKRWGAPDTEINATCRDGDRGNRWYNAEQTMRNTGAKSNSSGKLVLRSSQPITLDMLESRRYLNQPDSSDTNLGSARSPQPDVKAYLPSPQFLQDLSK